MIKTAQAGQIPATGRGAATTAHEKVGSIRATMPNAAKPATFQMLMVANQARHEGQLSNFFSNRKQAK
jgi:hypothetical protein